MDWPNTRGAKLRKKLKASAHNVSLYLKAEKPEDY